MGEFGEPHSGNLLYHLCQHDDFMNIVKAFYKETLYPAVTNMLDNQYVDSLGVLLAYDANLDNNKYDYRYSVSYDEALKRISVFLKKRSDFLQWYWSDPEELICVEVKGNNYEKVPHERDIWFYGNPEEGIELPQIKQHVQFNNDPILSWRSVSDGKLLQAGDIIRHSQTIEIEKVYPTWKEVQLRRIKKKMRKMLHS